MLPVLHGPFGEDGTIQGLLEMAGVPTSGPGVLASAVSMDKEYMKMIFQARGLPVGPHVVVRERDWPLPGASAASGRATAAAEPAAERKRVLDAIAELGWPLFVKPARGGSSIGTSKATDLTELHDVDRLRQEVRPEGDRRGGDRGRGDRVRRCWRACTARRRTPACPGELQIGGGEEFFDFEAQVPGRGQRDGDPGADPGGAPAGDPPDGRGGLRGGVL